jgi:hypothetical protein
MDDDITEMRRIRVKIDQAATTQVLTEEVIRFVAFIAKFVWLTAACRGRQARV